MYSRRPLEFSQTTLHPAPTLHSAPDSSQKVKDVPLLSPPFPPPLLSSVPPPRSQLTSKGENRCPVNIPSECWPLNKSGVPLITPVQGPDLRSVALYQSLLRHHPTYRHLLDSFLVPPFPPFLCPPPAVLGDLPFAYCSPPIPPHTSVSERQRHGLQLGPLGLQAKSASPQRPSHNHEAKPVAEPKTFSESPESQSHKGCEEKSRDSAADRPTPKTDTKTVAGTMLSAEELVSSITAVPDPYQQYGYGRKLFPCPQCRYTTDRRNNLKRHMLTMHQLSAKLLECCGLLFRTKAALREHALIFHYHGYTCFYCARRFCRKALLKRHLSVHNGQKEFLCNVCDYATSHKSNLERHRRVHMRQDDDISYDDGMAADVRETSAQLSEDEISVCSHDEEMEEINVHSD